MGFSYQIVQKKMRIDWQSPEKKSFDEQFNKKKMTKLHLC